MDKKYDIIVIDPPWEIKKITHRERPNQVNMDYSLMSLDQISKLPVRNLASNSCLCFLWTIQKYLFDSKAILEGWGFSPLITMVWEKTYGKSAGMPLFGFRWNAEFILVGYNKKPEMWPKRKLIPAVFQAENIRHSQKPDIFYKMIEPLGEKRIDLFARNKREGWDVWGNEVESDITWNLGK
jgi:N6-adenosine-specific RNA methylase IME4